MAMTGGPAKSQRTDPGSRSQHYYSPARPLARSLPTAHCSLLTTRLMAVWIDGRDKKESRQQYLLGHLDDMCPL